jgi:Transglutaminase-like superfamily
VCGRSRAPRHPNDAWRRVASCRRRWGPSAVLGLAIAAISLCAEADSVRRYDVLLDGHPTGSATDTVTQRAGRTVTQSEEHLLLFRAGQRLEVEQHATYEEDATGLLRATVTGAMAGDGYGFEAIVHGRHVHRSPRGAAQRYATDVDAPGPVLGPEALRRATLAGLHHPHDHVRYVELADDTGEPVVIERRLANGRTVGQPFAVIDHYAAEDRDVRQTLDADGELLDSEEESPLGHLVVRRVADDQSSAPIEGAPIGVAAEVTTNVSVPAARAVDRLTVRLQPHHGALDPADFRGAGQIAQSGPGGGVVVTIERPGRDAASRQPPKATERGPNAYFDSDQPELRALAQALIQPHRADPDRVAAIVDFVAQTLSFDAGFATGAPLDVLHRRRGTCVAYATLTATLLRAAGFPSRVVYGYVLSDSRFIGHAWTEAWVNDRWIAVDAAVHAGAVADAARIALARSDGHDGPASGLDTLARTLGRFEIAIGSYHLEGHPEVVTIAAH